MAQTQDILNTLVTVTTDNVKERHEAKKATVEIINSFTSELLPKIEAAISKLQQHQANGQENHRDPRIQRLQQFAYEADRYIGLYNLKQAKKRHVEQKVPLPSPLDFLYGPYRSRREFKSNLQDLQEKSEKLCNEVQQEIPDTPASELGSQEDNNSAPSVAEEGKSPKPVGQEDALKDLGKLLSKSPDGKLKVISVVGPRGIGKTLLATRAQKEAKYFDKIHFIHVKDADEYCLMENATNNGTTTPYNKDRLIEYLPTILNTRYLIVVDDVRNKEHWDNIKSAFPDSNQLSSRVIVTTTNQKIADHCSNTKSYNSTEEERVVDGYVYKMTKLNGVHSRILFHRPPRANPSDDLRTKCDGLPLALLSTAKLAAKEGDDVVCHRLGEFLKTEDELKRMQWAVGREYSSIKPPSLQLRLKYFCMLNRTAPISRNSIARRWLAEEFEDCQPERMIFYPPMQREVDTLMMLVEQNIIRSTDDAWKPSGMMLEYISDKSKAEKFIAIPNRHPKDTCIRRLSLHHGANSFNDFGESRPWTLGLSGNAHETVFSFADCKLMRVLDLENCANLKNRHMKKICKLLLLKYLSLGPGVTEIPRKIADLHSLETLDLRKTKVETIPLEVLLLPELRHLLGRFQLSTIDYFWGKRKLKKFLSNESKLETLAGFVTGRNGQGFAQPMGNMMSLMKVTIFLAHESNLTDLSKGIKAYMKRILEKSMPPGANRPNPPVYGSLSVHFQDLSETFLTSPAFEEFLNSPPDTGSLFSLKLLRVPGPRAGGIKILQFFSQVSGIVKLCLSSKSTLLWDAEFLRNMVALQYLKLEAVEGGGQAIIIEPETLKIVKRMCIAVGENLPSIEIQSNALQKIESLYLTCGSLSGASPNKIIKGLDSLMEVRIHSTTVISADIKKKWREVASGLRKRPQVFFIEGSVSQEAGPHAEVINDISSSPIDNGIEKDFCSELREWIVENHDQGSVPLMKFGEIECNGQYIAESFADRKEPQIDFIEAFIRCLRHDVADGDRIFVDPQITTIVNSEETTHKFKNPHAFESDALINALKNCLPSNMSINDVKMIMVPLCHRDHWMVYVFNVHRTRIDILDSNPYGTEMGGTTWQQHHEQTSSDSYGGDKRPWYRIMIGRLSDAIHRILETESIIMPHFEDWDVDMAKDLPRMEASSEDCAFFLMRYLQFYDYERGIVDKDKCRWESRALRSELLHYLLFHSKNELADQLPRLGLEQFRVNTPVLVSHSTAQEAGEPSAPPTSQQEEQHSSDTQHRLVQEMKQWLQEHEERMTQRMTQHEERMTQRMTQLEERFKEKVTDVSAPINSSSNPATQISVSSSSVHNNVQASRQNAESSRQERTELSKRIIQLMDRQTEASREHTKLLQRLLSDGVAPDSYTNNGPDGGSTSQLTIIPRVNADAPAIDSNGAPNPGMDATE